MPPKISHPCDLDNSDKDRRLDRTAIAISGLCLLHCLAVPIALLLGAAVGDWLIATESHVHWLLLGIAAPVSIWALVRGYRDHGNLGTLALGIVGLSLMLLGVSHILGFEWEVPLTVVGVLGVMIAHVRNTLARSPHTHS